MDSTEDLAADLSAHILRGSLDNFEPLALRVFAYQYANNAPYRRFCDGRKQTPETVTQWENIPPAPAAAFKRFALSCADPALCTPEHGGRTFHSSGTTGSETSKHYMDAATLQLYSLSTQTSYNHFVNADEDFGSIAALMPFTNDAPHSSLSFMLSVLQSEYDGTHFWEEDWSKLFTQCYSEYAKMDSWQNAPKQIFGTAFAWVQLFDYMAEQNIALTLLPGARIVETGGFKGRSREVERGELYQMFTERLGVPASHCVAEYGMSEMASQFYDTTYRDHVTGIVREPRKTGLPHLVRTRVMDPVTGQEARLGEPGILAHYDVCNLNSCLAIQTEDYGYAHPDGEGFVLLGRAPGAILRGCSLTAEEFAARQQNR
ncbi:MAG: hypothetical protein H7Y38_09250 [Armatimonadetes bacterium]|nr:hypothetical protein [Armatimonadota bacterium]